MTTDQAQAYAEKMEQKRDLRNELTGIDQSDEQEILFQEWSPGRRIVRLWSTETGEEIEIPRYMAEGALATRREDGQGYRFTANKAQAPAFVLGSVKCFLHPDSDERKSGLLQAAGLGGTQVCLSEHHPSRYAMEEIARVKHKKQWDALQHYLRQAREDEDRAQQRKQLDATLALAQGRVSEVISCEHCDWTSKPDAKNPGAALAGHMRVKHEQAE